MFKDTDFVTVVCPNCGNEFQKEFGWLKNNVTFHCGGCDHRLKHDPHQLLRLFNEDSMNAGRKIMLMGE